MNLPFNPCRKVVLLLAGLAMLLLCSPAAAVPAKEQHAFNAAMEALRDGAWERADYGFDEFIRKFPKSELRAEAVLRQAQALHGQKNSAAAADLLSANLTTAGFLADEYQFWLAEAQFQGSNYPAAAASYARVVNDFPVSDRKVEACVGEAMTYAQMGQWPQVIAVLWQTNDVFAQATQVPVMAEPAERGLLLLAEAYLMVNSPALAESTLARLGGQRLEPALDWRRNDLFRRILLAQNRPEEALKACTNLIAIANLAGPDLRGPLLADSVLFQSTILEQLGHFDEAVAVLQPNLAEGAPAIPQRASLLKVAELSMVRGRTAETRQALERFFTQHPDAPAADMALLALGELELKISLSVPATNGMAGAIPLTNRWQQAAGRFDQLLRKYPDSGLTGKAQLDKGWCLWLTGDITNSRARFETAAQQLPVSMDQAVAYFKWADAQLASGDYAGAVTNYGRVINRYGSLPAAREQLLELALYQQTRAALGAGHWDTAAQALRRIFDWYPNGFLGDRSLLLVGQGLMQGPDPARARVLFEEYAKHKPNLLLPEIQLAVARTYEVERDWAAAIKQYSTWLASFPNNPDRPRAEYYRAWANFQSGNETNAFIEFTNFVAQFPTNDFAPMAQCWVADHYFRQGEFVQAEKNYKMLFQTWPKSELALESCMMAGRAAVGWLNYSGAVGYFTNLTSRLDCPPKLKAKALFAYGDALQLGSTDTNRQANLNLAASVYSQICQLYPTNEPGALAWGQIGNCYLQMAAQEPRYYESATNAYLQVMMSPYAGAAARSQAQVGIGKVLEKQAARRTGAEQTAALKPALDNYLDVVYGKNLRDGESADPFWTKQAGYEAVRLAGQLQNWDQAENLCRRLQKLFPVLAADLDKRLARLQEQRLASEKSK